MYMYTCMLYHAYVYICIYKYMYYGLCFPVTGFCHKRPCACACRMYMHMYLLSTLQVAMVPTRLFSATNTASVHRDGLPDPPSRTHGPPLTPTHTARHTSGDEQHNRHSRAHTGDVDSPTQHDITSTPPPPPPPHSPPPPPLTTSASTAATSGTVHSTLLDAMEGACRGVLSVKCRVLRLYRRAVYTTEALGS